MCICDAVPIRAKWLRYCLVTIVFTLLISAIPMFLVLMVPIAMVIAGGGACGDSICDDYGGCTGPFLGVPLLICSLNCGICLMPLGIVGALCSGPFFVCYGGFVLLEEYLRNITEAKRRA